MFENFGLKCGKSSQEVGKLIFTTLNGLFSVIHSVKDFLETAKVEYNVVFTLNKFELMTFRHQRTITVEEDNGLPKELHCTGRYYVPSGTTWLFNTLNSDLIEILVVKLGAFSRIDKQTTIDFEILVIPAIK